LKKYFVMVGDVIGSTTAIRDRVSFRDKLFGEVKMVNKAFHEDFLAEMDITMGDSISGVLRRVTHVYRIIDALLGAVRPISIRFAVVYGTIDVGVKSRRSRLMSGQAFIVAAKQAMPSMRENKTPFLMLGGDKLIDPLVTSVINAVIMLKSEWTERQFQVARLYGQFRNQREVGRRLKITQAAVSKMLKAANIHAVWILENDIDQSLGRYQERLSRQVSYGGTR